MLCVLLASMHARESVGSTGQLQITSGGKHARMASEASVALRMYVDIVFLYSTRPTSVQSSSAQAVGQLIASELTRYFTATLANFCFQSRHQ
jgi:hypothetical protein